MWRGGRVVGTVLGAVVLLAVTATPAHAVILNFGVDIANDGSFSLTPFYDRSDDGKFLRGGLTKSGKVTSVGDTYTLTLDFTSAFTDYRINSATLFVDAKDVGSDDNGEVWVQGTLLGELADTRPSVSSIPLEAGGTTLTPDKKDEDNTFFALSPEQAGQLADDSSYTVSFHNADFNTVSAGRNNFRVDGINIQVDVTHNPEPASFLLFGLGGLGALGLTSRHRRTVRRKS